MNHPSMTRYLLVLSLFPLLFGLSIPASAHTISTASFHSYDSLQGASCANASNCWAVGFYTTQTSTLVLTEHWNGAKWSFVPGATPAGSKYSQLWGVSCPDASTCMAVGEYTKAGVTVSLAELWNGTAWSIIPTPNVIGSTQDYLEGVSCTSATSCIAVGYYFSQSVQTLAERWDGTSWSLTPISSPGTFGNLLFAVSCSGAGFCMAAGDASNRAGTQVTLIEHWDGTAWSVVTSPNPPRSLLDTLFGISCASASTCVAVGEYTTSDSTPFLTMIERWNGTRWSLQTSPNLQGSTNDALGGVACISASICMTAGSAVTQSAVVTLVERWNGSKWSIVATPNAPGPLSAFGGIACASSTRCIAVGDYDDGLGSRFAFAESWNGSQWTIVPVPVPHSE